MGDPQFGGILGPKRGEMDILTDLATSVHFDSLALKLRKFQFDGTGWVSCGDLELKFEAVSDEVVAGGASALPLGPLLVGGLDLEPVIVLLFVKLDVSNDCLEFFLEAVLPLLVLGAGVDAEDGDLVSGLLDTTHHCWYNYAAR